MRIRNTNGLLLAGLVALATAGCKDECQTTREYFAKDVWAGFMGTDCFKCHSPDGVAVANKSRFVLQPASYPGFLDANLASIRELSKTEYEGTSLLLLKPLGEQGHGGGKVLEEGSDQYEALVELVERVKSGEGDSCGDEGENAQKARVETQNALDTLRRTTLHFNGRLPTEEEKKLVGGGGFDALDAVLAAQMKEPAFLERLMDLFNDELLTDKYATGRNALDLLNTDEYPRARAIRDIWNDLPEAQRRAYNNAVAREPLAIIRWVVENDLPFTDILTADWTVVDDALAEIYGVQDGKTGVRTAQVTTATGIVLPHAGVLTTPAFLNRVPTTPTNRSRARARVLLKTFLATDILKIADRPIDISQVTAKDNPTLNHESCTVCHRVIDPIAGAFRGWDERDYELFRPESPWHDDMLHPGFGTVDMPSAQYGSAVQWLAVQMAAVGRFDLAMVHLAWKIVSGRGLLDYPPPGAPDFDARLKAWEAQDQFYRDAVKVFVDNGRRYRPLLRWLIQSPEYRATRAPGADAATLTELEAIGTARLVSPEVLNRKIAAVTGVRWRQFYDWQNNRDWFNDVNYRLLYGGIDSDNVVVRAPNLNGVMSNLSWRIASEVSCLAVPFDFSKPQEERVLFPYVRLIEVPESAGHLVPGAVENVKRNIVWLHERVLGERLTIDSPEVEATWKLFIDTWREGDAEGLKAQSLSWPCGLDPETGRNLPDEVRRDRDFVQRAWMAVLTYLLVDYSFLYE